MRINEYKSGKIINSYDNSETNIEYDLRNISYSDMVVMFIREKYTLDDELAIQRQKETKPDEWEAYFAYCEECKKKAKQVLEVENE